MNTAYVNIWNKRVGAVSWDPDRRLASFEYDAGFSVNGWDIAPLKMPLEQSDVIYSFPELSNTSTFKGLPGLLADILPDRYGNTLINTWLARNGREADSMNPVEMLCFVGRRGMGALEFEPVNPQSADTSTKLEIASLIEIARDLLNDRQQFNSGLGADREKALLDIIKIGTSAGGARAKALIAYNDQTKEVRSGQAEAPKGFSHWIIKFDGVHDSQFGESYGYGRVEMAYHLMAKDCGIEMTECRLLEEGERAHFMTKRFDRAPGQGKIHVQSWCAINHADFQEVGAHSYEGLFQTMRALILPYPQAEQLYRRMVFNIIARNCDDHTKNFSFMMDKQGVWKLAPAFDVCYAYRPGSVWVSRQSLTVNGKRENFKMDDLLNLAKEMNIKKAAAIISEIQGVLKKWPFYADQVGVKAELKDEIKSNLLKL
ncbi:serine/threonine-protein kinase HipA [Daejeonella rubra]|uniref:Serine/threonine-protein kinase HipA n=1 Tax=Daejeonella rubra TaxID=990371 RepID=A0A1G9N1F1_9SPHI|nr:type II toxin-antitoxin system HipA family toxin [Daejeonella rubra]SDL80194.1 serine/threonine-protein kinase HipA [Daejeonella rubra]